MKGSAAPRRQGLAFAFLAFGAWGIIPLYWHLLGSLSPLVILACRVVFSAFFVGGLLAAVEGFGQLREALRVPRTRWMLLLSSLLIGGNWFVFIGAIQWKRLSDASLGYFINPLMSVALGVFVLGERLRPLVRASVVLAGIAVVLLVAIGREVPWIALVLSTSFAIYGLVRKTVPVNATAGLFAESIALFPVAAVYLGIQIGTAGLPSHDAFVLTLAALSGPVTALPLVWFSRAARNLPLTVLGLTQYIAPTLQFAIAVFVFDEPMPTAKWASFSLIWLALVLFSVDLFRQTAEARRARGSAP